MSNKATICDLALYGGSPAFCGENRKSVGASKALFDINSFCGDVAHIVVTGVLTNGGPKVTEFEHLICKRLQVRNAICVCNATVALQVALRALNVTGEIIVPSFTFVATAHAASWMGMEVRFCDINPETFTLCTKSLTKLITPKTGAIIPVHVYGKLCNTRDIERIAARYNIPVIYDAAHAFGCVYEDNTYVGTKGDCEVFSFHATKCMSSMEGGAITTNDDALAIKLRTMINFGFHGYDCVKGLGTNGKMCEVNALYGIYSLSTFDIILDMNRRNYISYQKQFLKFAEDDSDWADHVQLLPSHDGNNYHYVVMRWSTNDSRVDRDFVVAALTEENCMARRYFFPGIHAFEYYRESQPWAELMLNVTTKSTRELICLPTGPQMSDEDVTIVCDLLIFMWKNRWAIHDRLSKGKS